MNLRSEVLRATQRFRATRRLLRVVLAACATASLFATLGCQHPTRLPIREGEYSGVIRVACVGDSITFGHQIPNRERAGYPARLQAMLGAKWEVGNFGRSGATVLRKSPRPYHEQPEFSAALAFQPHVVVLQLGTNDTKRETWEAEGARFVADYQELIRRIQSLDTKPRIILCRPVPLFRDRGKPWDTDALLSKEILPRIDQVARTAGLPLIDLNGVFAARADLMPDGVHPDARGAELMAGTIYHALTGRHAPEAPK